MDDQREKASSQEITARHADWSLVNNCLSSSSRRFLRCGMNAREWHHDTWGLAGAGSSISTARGPSTFSCGIALNLPSHGRPDPSATCRARRSGC
jgi:hypothetical protein